jgi:hypothetical protein
MDVLKVLHESELKNSYISSKSPLSLLQKSYYNMLNYILPELEAYCIAYKVVDVLQAYGVRNCNPELASDISSVTDLIKYSTNKFISLLYDVIEMNPNDTSLIFSIENIIDTTKQYSNFIEKKSDDKESVLKVLKDASIKANIINSRLLPYEEPEFLI